MTKFWGLFILLGLFSGFCGKTDNPVGNTSRAPAKTINSSEENSVTHDSTAGFGEKIRFSKAAPVKFSDFTLTYIGERRVISELSNQAKPNFREFVYYDFKIKTEKEEKTVSWSSGTGDIAPAAFEIGGKKYDLELRISDKLGKLAENELVIWKKL